MFYLEKPCAQLKKNIEWSSNLCDKTLCIASFASWLLIWTSNSTKF